MCKGYTCSIVLLLHRPQGMGVGGPDWASFLKHRLYSLLQLLSRERPSCWGPLRLVSRDNAFIRGMFSEAVKGDGGD